MTLKHLRTIALAGTFVLGTAALGFAAGSGSGSGGGSAGSGSGSSAGTGTTNMNSNSTNTTGTSTQTQTGTKTNSTVGQSGNQNCPPGLAKKETHKGGNLPGNSENAPGIKGRC